MYDYEKKASAGAQQETPDFSRREIKKLVHDLFTPKPLLYWADFLITVSIGYGFAVIYLMAPAFSLVQMTAGVVSGLALFRVGIFIHELVHREESSMVGFHIVWNLLFGVPFLLHSLLYRSHLDHHHPRKFGTPAEGEYLPLGSSPIRETVLYLAQIPVVPLLAAFRFLVLVPLSFLYPPSRRWVLESWSSYTINPYYRRVIPSTEPQGLWAILDLLCLLWLVVVIGLIFTGVIAWTTVGLMYGLTICTIALNWVRTLAAHRFLNTGGNMTYVEQIEDSLTIEGRSLLTLLLFPIGLRYHALHHLFPLMPYHSMGEAHRRLMQALPDDSPYKKAIFPGFVTVLRDLLRHASLAGKAGRDPMQVWRHAEGARFAQ
ncbi:MAG TPA: fatty acid desaturase [Patescibacteria group bacterium]|nr:fatty acid desaturase [Patescibacteria group bacterium]